VANPKLSTLVDAFTTPTIDTTIWGTITAGAVALDTVNDEVQVTVPTAAGTSQIGTTALYDATGSSVYARVTAAANGSGNVRTILRLRVDANNSMSIRVESGVLKQTSITAGATTSVTLPAYDPNAHRWWRLREAGGLFYADVSVDGLTWTNLSSMAYVYDVTGITVRFEAVSTATEVAGNTATLAGVNTRAGGPDNPNWPGIEDGWGAFWSVNAGTFPADRFVEISGRTRGNVSVQRGRQYETDQVRSGEASLRLANTDAALDPVNTASPWFGHITPYQPYRRRAQWPVTRNVLDQAMATGGDVGGYALGTIPSSADIFSSTDTAAQFVASASAWAGGTVIQASVPSGSAIGARPCHTPRWSVLPGQTYTVQLRVRNVTAATSLSVQAFFGWYVAGAGSTPASFAYGTSSVLTGATAAGWTYITATATAPANASGMDVGVALAAAAAATANLQVDGWQLEKGSVASAWTCPGLWSPVYAGWTERWPSSWDLAGLYPIVEPNAVDTFALLSQQQLDDALTMELNANTPRFVYKLDDPAGSAAVTDWTGNNPPAQIGISKYGAGSLVFGNAITANDPDGIYTGSTDTVARISNSNPGTNLVTGGASFIKLASAGIVGPADPTQWTRAIAFRYTGPMPTSGAYLWSSMDNQRAGGTPSGSHIYVFIDTTGKPQVWIQGPTGAGTSTYFGGATNVVDGDWHLLIFGYSTVTGQLLASQDGSVAAYIGGIPATNTPSGLIADNLGAFVDATVSNGTTFNFKGDVSFAAEFPNLFGSSAISNLYQAWKSACAGESTTDRYARILRYAAYRGPTSLQAGMTQSMGPASIAGQDAMSALQAVVDTENGAHYVDAAGAITFRARSTRYNALTPMFTFGERIDLGEWPYEDITLDFDSTHLSNQVTVQQEGTQQNFYATDAASTAAYFPRTMSRTINASDTNECNDAAYYLLSRYRQPATRVNSLRLHPSANPALWPVCLALELGTRVRVIRRAPGVPPVTVECFVENIAWDFGTDNEAFLDLQCSPADLTPYGVFASWHTTLNTGPASGVTSVTVKASADNTNLLAQQIAPGQQLVLGYGTANQETVTVASVGATSPGWTTGVLALTAATTKSHAANDVVCEPLPAGTTGGPTTWDAVAQFDSIAFAY
jgi:hypothetical protein